LVKLLGATLLVLVKILKNSLTLAEPLRVFVLLRLINALLPDTLI
jgi:hypothetical protein